uniref:Disease resistance R13L4/SHOC-2-like LRR domain-containing protein n=1 Tax=Arundo donax TaxID=35708 RepID=A0A0A9G8H0_ARUDO
MSMQHVRSLSTFRPKGQLKLLDRLHEFTLLRVLDLEGCKDVQDHHMKHVCGLFLLRFLSLRGTDITEIPSQIEELRHLQILDLRGTLLRGVPESLINLEKLEILDLSNRNDWRVLLRLPQGIQKMKALQRLDRFELCNDAEVAKEIGDLVQLRHLGIILNGSTEQVRERLANSIGKISTLRSMTVETLGGNMNFLQGLPSPPQLLQSICLCGAINRFPSWVESHEHLADIYVYKTCLRGDQIFGVLCKLPNLVKLSLDRYSYMDQQLVARTKFKFPALKQLHLVPDYGTPKVLRFEKEAMSEIEMLTMRYFDTDRSLQGIEHLTSLKEVKLKGEKNNKALGREVDLVKAESNSREKLKQFMVVVQYE